jgi:hypothetical protein
MDRLWTKQFIQMTAGMLFLFTGFYLLLPTIPVYIKQLGGSESLIGLSAGAFTLSAVIFRPIVGGLLDRYGRRHCVVNGAADRAWRELGVCHYRRWNVNHGYYTHRSPGRRYGLVWNGYDLGNGDRPDGGHLGLTTRFVP